MLILLLLTIYQANRDGVQPRADSGTNNKPTLMCKDPAGGSFSEGALIRGSDGGILRCSEGKWTPSH